MDSLLKNHALASLRKLSREEQKHITGGSATVTCHFSLSGTGSGYDYTFNNCSDPIQCQNTAISACEARNGLIAAGLLYGPQCNSVLCVQY